MFQIFLLICVIAWLIYICNNQKKKEDNKTAEYIKQRNIAYARTGNRIMLNKLGEKKFALLCGEDQLQLVKNDKDTESIEYLPDWKERIMNGGSYYVR